MFCKNCGSQIGDNQKFCPNCGTPVQETGGSNPGAGRQGYGGGYQQGGYNQGGQPSGRRSARPLIILIVGIVVLAGIIAGIVLGVRSCTAEDGGGSGSGSGSGGPFAPASGQTEEDSSGSGAGSDAPASSYTDPVDAFMEGMEQQDGRKIMEAFSEGTIRAMEEESGYSEAEIAEMFEEEYLSSLEEYGDFTIDYEIAEEEDLSAEDIAEIQEEFDYAGVNEEIQEGKELGIYMTIEVDGMSDEDDMLLHVIKIDGEWYLSPTSM